MTQHKPAVTATIDCDHGGCQTPPIVTITAAYHAYLPANPASHPLYATYPAPMAYACGTHIAALIELDAAAPGSTEAWLIQPLTDLDQPRHTHSWNTPTGE